MKHLNILLISAVLLFSCKQKNNGEPHRASANIVQDDEPFETDEALELNSQALELAQQGNCEEAKELFLKAHKIEESNPTIMNNMGLCLMESNNYDEAIGWFKKALEANSSYLKAYVNMGLTYFHMKEYKKTLEVNQVVIDSGSDESDIIGAAYLHNAMAFFELKDCEQAKQNFEKANELLKDTYEAQEMLQSVGKSINECSLNSLMQ